MGDVSSYRSKMYVIPSPDKKDLLSGDIVILKSEDFEQIVLHPTMLNLLKQFEKEKPNRPSLWVILNKPCDMVYSKDSRSFTSNLILVPLQGLKANIKNGGFLSKFRTQPPKAPSPVKSINKFVFSFILTKVKEESPKPEELPQTEYLREVNSKVSEQIETSGIKEKFEEASKDTNNPEEFMTTLVNWGNDNQPWGEIIDSYKSSKEWETYKEAVAKAKKEDEQIIIKEGNGFSQLCNNQLDTQGVFFLEPHPRLLEYNYDACFILELEDMLTIKIKPEVQKNGFINELLASKRVLSLEPSFSARLQNFMTVYLGKVGTDDILSSEIIKFYQNEGKKFGADITFPDPKDSDE